MSALTDVLHKIVHMVAGPDNAVHEDIDNLAKTEEKTAVTDVAEDAVKAENGEGTPDAAE